MSSVVLLLMLESLSRLLGELGNVVVVDDFVVAKHCMLKDVLPSEFTEAATSRQIGLQRQNTFATDLWTKVRHFPTSWVHSERLLTQPLGMYSVLVVVEAGAVVVVAVIGGVVDGIWGASLTTGLVLAAWA